MNNAALSKRHGIPYMPLDFSWNIFFKQVAVFVRIKSVLDCVVVVFVCSSQRWSVKKCTQIAYCFENVTSLLSVDLKTA